MGTNGAIDVAIALILMYLILSLIVTVANEQVSTAVDLRSANLRSAIVTLLNNDNLVQRFDNHGLIRGLNQALVDDSSSWPFQLLAWLCRLITGVPAPTENSRMAYLSGSTFASALLNSLPAIGMAPTLADFRTAIEALPANSSIRGTLLAQLAAANNDLEKFRTNVATWFDSSMDRVSGLYKRSLKKISFVIGLLLALVVNADSVKVSKALWNDAALRASVVESASAYLKSNPGAGGSNGAQAVAASDPSPDSVAQKVQALQQQLRPVPLGWTYSNVTSISNIDCGSLIGIFASKIIGLLLTAFAISLGAPFWFDLLGMFVKIRGTGDKPARTPPLQ